MRCWHSLALFASALLVVPLTAAQDGTPTPQPPHLVSNVVPANGVIGVWLPAPEVGDTLVDGRTLLRVTAADGSLVEGSVSARKVPSFAVFRPSHALVEGASYTLEFVPNSQGSPSPFWKALEFDAVAERDPHDPPTHALIEGEYVDNSFNMGACCGTTCFDTAVREAVTASLSARFDAADSVIGQYLYSFAWENSSERSWSTRPEISVLPATSSGPAFEPCRVLWAYSLSDETQHMLGRGCVDEQQLLPEHVVSLVPMFDEELAFDRCKQPPQELLVRWCWVNREACAGEAAACPGYDARCPNVGALGKRALPMLDESEPPAGCAVSHVRSRRISALSLGLGLLVISSARAMKASRRRS